MKSNLRSLLCRCSEGGEGLKGKPSSGCSPGEGAGRREGEALPALAVLCPGKAEHRPHHRKTASAAVEQL